MTFTFAQKCVLDELRTAGSRAGEFLPTYALWWWNCAAGAGRRQAFMSLFRKGIVERVQVGPQQWEWKLTPAGAQAIAEPLP